MKVKIKVVLKTLLIVFAIILAAYLIIINLTPVNFKINISKAKILEIYVMDNNEFILQEKIEDQEIVDDFIEIFSSAEFENNPMMTLPLPKYKLIFYNDNNKEIAEIKCLPNVIISDLYGRLKIGKTQYDLLSNLIESNIKN